MDGNRERRRKRKRKVERTHAVVKSRGRWGHGRGRARNRQKNEKKSRSPSGLMYILSKENQMVVFFICASVEIGASVYTIGRKSNVLLY